MKNPRKMWVFSWTLGLFSSFFILPVRGNTCSAMVQAAPGDDLTALRNKAFASFRAQCRGKQVPPTDDLKCSEGGPFGMEDGRIPDASITVSSMWNNPQAIHGPTRARLNLQAGRASAWCSAGDSDANPWIQVVFGSNVIITGVITQGRWDNYQQWVTEFKVAYSDDGQEWTNVTDDGSSTPMKFPGNSDKNTHVTTTFPKAFQARFLRILPTLWHNYCCMRFEVLGCTNNE